MKSPNFIRQSPYFLGLAFIVIFSSCSSRNTEQTKTSITIFHAGSLSIPIKEIAEKFEGLNPNVDILLESSGSVSAIRKITDLNRSCDVIALADEALIDTWLIPDFATWNLHFASNEMIIAYTESSRFSEDINDQNWHEILLKPEVRYGRSDPNSDPCGYRTELSLKLAHEHYSNGVDYEAILAKDKNYIRPKASDLVALLETGALDYVFEYSSVAKQHGFNILHLPDQINLSNPDFSEIYASVGVEISGKVPGEKVLIEGKPMVYGITTPSGTAEPDLALKFVEYFISTNLGMAVLEKHGQKILKAKYSESSTKKPNFELK